MLEFCCAEGALTTEIDRDAHEAARTAWHEENG